MNVNTHTDIYFTQAIDDDIYVDSTFAMLCNFIDIGGHNCALQFMHTEIEKQGNDITNQACMSAAAYGIQKAANIGNFSLICRYYRAVNDLVLIGIPINLTNETASAIISNMYMAGDDIYIANILNASDFVWTDNESIKHCFTTEDEIVSFLRCIASTYTRFYDITFTSTSSLMSSNFWNAIMIFKLNIFSLHYSFRAINHMLHGALEINHGLFCCALMNGCNCGAEPNCSFRQDFVIWNLVEGWYERFSDDVDESVINAFKTGVHNVLDKVPAAAEFWSWAIAKHF